MRAVNLMPRDSRAMSSGSGSGAGVYVLLAGLGALVVLATLWALAGKQVDDRAAELTVVNAKAAAAEKRAGDSAAYVAFAKLANDRVLTVSTLSATRFDWAHAMREVSRVLPADVWLSTMTGISGAVEAAPTPSASAAPAPTVTLQGCTRSQAKVARLLARLRTIDGVRKVSLKISEKPDAKGDREACPANRVSDPHFTIAISFAVPGAPKAQVDATGQVGEAAAATATTPSGGSSSTTSASTTSDQSKDG